MHPPHLVTWMHQETNDGGSTMIAAVWHSAGDVRVENVEDPPKPGPGEVLVDVSYACICASDLAEYVNGPHVIPVQRPHPLTGKRAPVTLGHEFSGRVAAVGEEVETLNPGDRVCGDACIRCGSCYWCLRGEYNICSRGGSIGLHSDGAFASRLTVPAYTLFKVPDEVSDRDASIVEPLAVGLHALKRGGFTIGDTVAILGFGMVGASVLKVAKSVGVGATIVVELSEARADLASSLGASLVAQPDEDLRHRVKGLTDGVGADLVVDCTGNAKAAPMAIELSRRGGKIVACGIPHGPTELRLDRLIYFERDLVGSLGYSYDHPAILRLLADGRLQVNELFEGEISLDEIVSSGFERLRNEAGMLKPRIPIAIGG